MAILEVKNLEVYYGVIKALKGISFEVNEGEIVALIGANGAGKTTTLHTITGLLKAAGGSIGFNGCDITKVRGDRIVGMGMAHVPEGRRVFADLTVFENLKLGAYTRKDKTEIEETLQMIYKRFPRLLERKNQPSGTLSGGEQQMTLIARALVQEPEFIMMDEPTSNLDYGNQIQVLKRVVELKNSGKGVVMITHSPDQAFLCADEAVLFFRDGSVVSGEVREVLTGEKISRLYGVEIEIDTGKNRDGAASAWCRPVSV